MQVFDGQKLKDIRKNKKLTQYDLAKYTGIAQTRISDIERNTTIAGNTEKAKIISALDFDLSYFLSDEKDIKVVVNTFKKGKNREKQLVKKQEEIYQKESKQLELFDEKTLIGQDLAGFILISSKDYQDLLDAKKRLEKLENIISEVKNV
ncbi:helix-turn-helix domain-containing protein [Streptococcus uberis]|uniref:helix-turn-helix domain-containing protein n=1 Tax=Streptococcus uberis TaxID=1349 RepID=UPI0027DB71CD|nr:helix-turn-helix transcriptional regulator [Streptococcus uberis]MCK1239258.1 helix-turn-helix domain-containing protein [Streptococcus uberis]